MGGNMAEHSGLHIALISLHGLVRGTDIELGRDADTGGQVKYVVELARALGEHPAVRQVDLLTRRIQDPKVDASYAEPLEPLGERARIVRIGFGPRRYFRKEVLWPFLEEFIDGALQYFRSRGCAPDVIHAHYADAGLAGTRLASLLGVPFVFTGHSLGREKKRRLQVSGLSAEQISARYNIEQRIEAEEIALAHAALLVTSTRQEADEQYAEYANYSSEYMRVIPPGMDVSRFAPPWEAQVPEDAPVVAEVRRFLRDPQRPLIFAMSRADERKNIHSLVQAFGEDDWLREHANLLIVAGNRDEIRSMERGASRVLKRLLLDIDRYDLYGICAYPKHHGSDDVPLLYRLAAKRAGVFVNPALTEPFGLTLLEAAASGVPVVATEDGGPRDILGNARNGLLIDPQDPPGIAAAIRRLLQDEEFHAACAKSGVRAAREQYSWQRHVECYLQEVRALFEHEHWHCMLPVKSRIPMAERLLIADIDNTLLGDQEALDELVRILRSDSALGFGIATGRRIESALRVLAEHGVPTPDVMITAVGAEIYYGPDGRRDLSWDRHIGFRWEPERIRQALADVPGLRLQPASEQRQHKISYLVDRKQFSGVRKLRSRLRAEHLRANLIFSHGEFLDILPVRASKGLAVRSLCYRWGIPMSQVMVAGDSGNDREMLTGSALGIIVGNYSAELARLKPGEQLYFADGHYARGIIEGMRHYGFAAAQQRLESGDVQHTQGENDAESGD